MREVEEVHALFRGAAEVAKRLRLVAGVLELLAAVVAFEGIAADSVASWQPLVAFLCLLIAAFLRMRSEATNAFAQRCRRVSIRAFAEGMDLQAGTCTTFRSDAPLCAARMSAKLPATTLYDYYQPYQAPGEKRLRELYAHSSFYTWRLATYATWFYGLLAAVVGLSTVVVLNGIVVSDATLATRAAALDALFSVVLAALTLRLVELAVASHGASDSARDIANALIKQPLPSGNDLDSLVIEYDVERVSAPAPSTVLYRICRNRLERDWHDRRRAFP
jgi:hypothetical protein